MKSYADECLERAEEATKGPWHTAHISEIFHDEADIEGPGNECIADDVHDFNRKFIIHARTDVPELAKRLKAACEALVLACDGIDWPHVVDKILVLVKELEAPL